MSRNIQTEQQQFVQCQPLIHVAASRTLSRANAAQCPGAGAEYHCSPESTGCAANDVAVDCIAGRAEKCTGACRANTQVASYTLTNIRVLVPQKTLINGMISPRTKIIWCSSSDSTRTSRTHRKHTHQQCHPLMPIPGNQFTVFCFSSPGNSLYRQNVTAKIRNSTMRWTNVADVARGGHRIGGLVALWGLGKTLSKWVVPR